MDDLPWNERPALQENCIHCGKPQYKGVVKKVSEGKDNCVWCGKPGEPMTNAEYKARMNVLQPKRTDYH